MKNQSEHPALYQTIFDASVEGILVANDQGIIIQANSACEKMFGYGRGEILGEKVETLVPKDLQKTHRAHRISYSKKPKARQMGQNLDLWGLKKDGSQFPLEISLSPSKINGKQVVIAFIIDTTKQREAKATLKESNRKFRTLINNLQGIVYRCKNDRDWTMEYISEGCEHITGYSPQEFIEGKVHFSHLTLKEDQDEVWEITQKAINNKEPFNLDFRIKDKEGNLKYLRELGQGIFDSRGNLEALEGFITDITPQKEVELQLRANEDKNMALLEAIPDMMVIQNFSGDILDFYAPEQMVLQVPRGEIIGKNIKEVVPETMSNAILKAHDEAIKTNKIQIREYSLDKNNREVHYEARTVRLNDHRLLTVVRDITEKKRADEQLRASETRNRSILQALPDLIVIHDTKGTYLDVHASDDSLLPYPKEYFIGKTVCDLIADKDLCKTILQTLSEVDRTKKMEVFEARIPLADRIIDFESRVVSLEKGKLLVVLRDVTETKAIQEVLHIRNRALATAGNGIIIVDAVQPDLPIIYCNDTFIKMTGYDRNEILGRNCRFLQKDDREQKAINTIRQALKQQKPSQTVLRNYRKDGTLFWNELTITPVQDEHGQLTHFIGVQNDVTERKKEEILKDQIRRILEMIALYTPLETIGNAIIKVVEGHFVKSKASILLYDPKHCTLHKLAAPNIPKPMLKALEDVSVQENSCSCAKATNAKKEVFITDITKNALWKNQSGLILQQNLRSSWSFPILSSDKKVLGTFAIYSEYTKKPSKDHKEIVANMAQLTSVAIEQHNIRQELEKSRWLLESYAHELEQKVTERTDELKATVQKLVETNLSLEDQIQETKTAEKKALASQAMFSAIARNFPKGVIIVFNSDFEIVYIDGGEMKRMGFNKSQFEGFCIDDIEPFSKQRIARIKEDIKKTLAGEQLSFEIKFRNKTYSVNTSPLSNGSDEKKWTLFVYNDITQLKQAEINMRTALVREQELNELKSRFISMASHEFRTPLSAILSSAILIGKQNQPGKEQKREKYVEQIQSNVRSLVVILNDFLSLSKLEEGKVLPKYEHFDLVEFTDALVEEIRLTKKRGQKITATAKPKTIDVYLDPKLTHHIIVNLLSNAIKYSDEGKDILVHLKSDNHQVTIAVIDKGIGIPRHDQDNLFQRFFRADNSTHIQGTGLGLHIVKQYTELMRGEVGFESVEGEGTTFWVRFPIDSKNKKLNSHQ